MGADNNNLGGAETPRLDVDSCTSVAPLGKCWIMLSEAGWHAEVAYLVPGYESAYKLLIVYAAADDFPLFWGATRLSVFYGSLPVPSVERNLIPPLTLNETCLEARTTPKKNSVNLFKKDYLTHFKEEDMITYSKLHRMLSHFQSCKLSSIVLRNSEIEVLSTALKESSQWILSIRQK